MMKVKKQKAQKHVIKKTKCRDYKKCLKVSQIENINYLEQKKTDSDSLKGI